MNSEDLIVISSVFPLALLVVLYVWWRVSRGDRRKAEQQSRRWHKQPSSRYRPSRPRPAEMSGPTFGSGALRSYYSGDYGVGFVQMMNNLPIRSRKGSSDLGNPGPVNAQTPLHIDDQWDDSEPPAVGADPMSIIGPVSVVESHEHEDSHPMEDPFLNCPENFGLDSSDR